MQQNQKNMASLCIPRIENTITKDYIYKTLCNLQIGNIDRITEIPLRNDNTHKRVIFKIRWNQQSKKSITIQKLLQETGSFKLVHDMPWYWKIVTAHPQI
jgi:hypothetical protein